MIKKSLSILLALSCTLYSLTVNAQANTIDTNKVQTSNTAQTSGSIADKVLEKISVKPAIQDLSVTPVEPLAKESVSPESSALESSAPEPDKAALVAIEQTPQVGKHVMANMNPGSMILSLLMVLGLIIVCALILKRFNLTQQGVSQLKVVTSLRLGTKERVIVIQVGEQQLLLGITGQQITLLDKLAEPIHTQADKNTNVTLPKNILSFLASKKI
ncbi:flagellar biosynthetic protein FliO [Colwellia echini]|uniref:Flagellar protein n=1 Tax=Colwellia echini TaxID=1982103 RepID=A0ABY3MX58_9GAMM|nr:flagellar biosynthetic protein FliO [Colwellia echini]TYK65617.1 flagellar biosynthetic protein FliO [Colwellia echini]